MELSDEQIASIRSIVERVDTKNRNKVLTNFFKDSNVFKDDKVFKVFDRYKNKMRSGEYLDQHSLELDISEAFGISKDEVKSLIKYIDFVSKKVDYELSAKYRKNYYKSHMKKLKNEQNIVRRKNECKTSYIKKDEVLRRQLDLLFKNYDEASQKGKLARKKLSANINEIKERIKSLGNNTEDLLVLASMYADIGELDKCNSILYKVEYDKLSGKEKQRYKQAKIKEINLTNISFITELYEKGYSYENIKSECERQATSYRAGIVAKGEQKAEAIGLTPQFIKKIYEGLKNGQIKPKNNKNEKER